jgi:hypothetical protein
MPMDRKLYPPDWDAISKSMKDRDGWKCTKCGVPHGMYVQRNKSEPFVWRQSERGTGEDCGWSAAKRIIVTVHHIGVPKPDGSAGDPCDKMDCRPENLTTLCQRCHLQADQEIRLSHARLTRWCKAQQHIEKSGQQSLWSE